MAATLSIAVGSVLLVVSGFIWVARRGQVNAAARIGALSETQLLQDVEAGRLCAVRGEVASGATVEDSVHGSPAVYTDTRVLRRDTGAVLYSRSNGETLRVGDGSSVVADVELVGAEIAITPEVVERSDREPTAKMAALIERGGGSVPESSDEARYELEHLAIRPGDALTLVGVGEADEEETILHFTSAHPLFLTPEPLADLQARQLRDLRGVDRMLAIGVGFGVLCLGAALVLGFVM